MPEIDMPDWSHKPGGPNPLSGKDNGPYAEIVLGDLAGLDQFGVRLERLPLGSRYSVRHWHEREEEFVYVVAGEPVRVEEQEVILCGRCRGLASGCAACALP